REFIGLLLAGLHRLRACHGDHRDFRLARTPSQLDEVRYQIRRLFSSAHDEEVTAGRRGRPERRKGHEEDQPHQREREAAVGHRRAPSCREIRSADWRNWDARAGILASVSRFEGPPTQIAATTCWALLRIGAPIATYPTSSSPMAVAYPCFATRFSSASNFVREVIVRGVYCSSAIDDSSGAPCQVSTLPCRAAASSTLPVEAAWAGHRVPMEDDRPTRWLPRTSSRIRISLPIRTSRLVVSPVARARRSNSGRAVPGRL